MLPGARRWRSGVTAPGGWAHRPSADRRRSAAPVAARRVPAPDRPAGRTPRRRARRSRDVVFAGQSGTQSGQVDGRCLGAGCRALVVAVTVGQSGQDRLPGPQRRRPVVGGARRMAVWIPRDRASAARSSTNRDFPMPGSPMRMAIDGRPARASSSTAPWRRVHVPGRSSSTPPVWGPEARTGGGPVPAEDRGQRGRQVASAGSRSRRS